MKNPNQVERYKAFHLDPAFFGIFMNFAAFFIAIYAAVLCSCAAHRPKNSASYALIKTQQPTDRYSIRFDTLRLYDRVSNGQFGKYSTYYSDKDTTFLVLEDCGNQRLDFLNLTTSSTDTVPINKSFCDKWHTLSLLSKDHYFKLDNSGDLIEFKKGAYTLIENFTQNEELSRLGLWAGGDMSYRNQIKCLSDSTILFPLDINPDFENRKFSNYDFGYPITGLYDLKTRKVHIEGITWPEFLYKNNFGLFNEIEQYYFQEYIYYGFMALPEIWRYNRKDKTLDRFWAKSTYDSVPTPLLKFKRTPKTKDKVYQHYKRSPHYRQLVHDPARGLFYRFYALPTPLKSADGLYSTERDRRFSVMVMDENFNLLAETLLPEGCFFIYFAVPADGSLYINYGPFGKKVNENGIKTLRITLVDSH